MDKYGILWAFEWPCLDWLKLPSGEVRDGWALLDEETKQVTDSALTLRELRKLSKDEEDLPGVLVAYWLFSALAFLSLLARLRQLSEQ